MDELDGITPMGVLRLMPNKASEIASFASQLIRSVKDGNTNALELHVALKALDLLSKEVREEIEENAIREASKHAEKKFNAFGAIVERGEVGTKYAYETSGDSQWEFLDSEFKRISREKADRETFLKALKEPMKIINTHMGGVEEEIRPPFKTSKEGIKVYISNAK